VKIKTCFSNSTELLLNRGSLILFLFGLFLTTPVFSQLPTAQYIAGQMKVGWNMGNTLEAICGETAWGGAYTTQRLIDSVKAAGFNTVRLPCAWDCHTTNGVINPAWMARVKEIVDYCIHDELYVILNIHWDGGWLENNVTAKAQASVNAKQENYWIQISNYFKNYDDHLLFAGANEPNVEDTTGMSVLLSYHQTFINAVRATGGNNSSRSLIIQGPSTDIDKTNNLMKTMPMDQIADRLMVEIHYYTPYQFTLMTEDASWGKMFFYWGKDYHSKTDVNHNATWGEESDVEKYFGLMKTQFVDKGIPVIMGEYHAMKRINLMGDNLVLHLASVEYWHQYVTRSAIRHGIIPVYWDINMGLFNRSTGAIVDQGLVDAIMDKGTASEKDESSSIPSKFFLGQNYPNPFNPSTLIDYQLPASAFVTLKVFDILGKDIVTLVNIHQNAGNYTVQFSADELPNGVYFYRLDAGAYHSTKKLLTLK
jgi:endoglucanase